MAATKHFTTAERISFQSPDGRVKVVRHGPRDFGLYLDGVCVNSFDYSYQAEHEGAVWLAEQAAQIAPAAQVDAPAPEGLPLDVEPLYREANGDLTGTPTEQVAYLEYKAQAGADMVMLSVAVDRNEEPTVLLFGREEVALSRLQASLAVLERILADPRVQAHRSLLAA